MVNPTGGHGKGLRALGNWVQFEFRLSNTEAPTSDVIVHENVPK